MIFLWAIRFFVFQLHESPKFLMGRGKDEQAVESVHYIAKYNGKESRLTVEDLQKAAAQAGAGDMETSAKAAALRTIERFRFEHVRALFATGRLAYSTTLIIILWGTHVHQACTLLDEVFASVDWTCFPTIQCFHHRLVSLYCVILDFTLSV
jgi:hypothetical protein